MKILFGLLFLMLSAQAQNIFDKFEINPEYSVLLQQAMLEHLKEADISKENKIQLLLDLDKINANLSGIDKENTNAFLFSEFFKAFYELENMESHISNSNIITAEEKLEQYKSLYSNFVAFFIKDSIQNYKVLSPKLLNNYKNKNVQKSFKEDDIKNIIRLNKYVGPWIVQFLKYDSKKFNQLCTKSILAYFQNLAKVSHFFKFNTPTSGSNKFILIKEEGKSLPDLVQELSNAEQDNSSIETKDTSSPADIQNIEVDPAEAASDKIDQLIEKIDDSQQ